jgi:hypothetical protein
MGIGVFSAQAALAPRKPTIAQGMATLSDGRVFTIGGSWNGGWSGVNGVPVKNGEVL